MNQMLPFILIGLLAVLFSISLFLVVRYFKKSLSDMMARLMSMDSDIEEFKSAIKSEIGEIKSSLARETDDIRKALDSQSAGSLDEINRKTTQIKDDIRAALKTYIESIIKKISENDAAQRSRFDSLASQIEEFRRKSPPETSKVAERTPETDFVQPPPSQAKPVQQSQPAPQEQVREQENPQPQPRSLPQRQPAEPAATREQTPRQPSSASGDLDAKARRLARLIVSDIALYNRKNVERGVKEGNFEELLEHEMREARALYERRVPEEIRNSTNYLEDAFNELMEKTKQNLNL